MGISEERIPKETVWTVEVDEIITVKRDGRVVRMPYITEIRRVGREMGNIVENTIGHMVEVGAKTLKMVVSWE